MRSPTSPATTARPGAEGIQAGSARDGSRPVVPPGRSRTTGCAGQAGMAGAAPAAPEPAADPTAISEMQRDLGRQLAALRHAAGLTQRELAAMTGFSRPAICLAEIGRKYHSGQFWQACDKALDTGGVLAAGADQISDVREARERAAAAAAQEARQARALAAFDEARQREGVSAAVTAVQACPHCGAQVTVLTTIAPAC